MLRWSLARVVKWRTLKQRVRTGLACLLPFPKPMLIKPMPCTPAGNERTLQYSPEAEGSFKLEIRWQGQLVTAQPIVIRTDSKPPTARHTML